MKKEHWYQKSANKDSFRVAVAVGIVLFCASAINEIMRLVFQLIPHINDSGIVVGSNLFTVGIMLLWFSIYLKK